MSPKCPKCKMPLILMQLSEGPDSYRCPACDQGKVMKEENTLLPWKTSNDLRERFEVGDCDGQAIIAQIDPYEDLPPDQREAIANLIVLACNAYDQDQKTIKSLAKALEAWQLMDTESADKNPAPCNIMRGQYRKIARELTEAALAKEKRNS